MPTSAERIRQRRTRHVRRAVIGLFLVELCAPARCEARESDRVRSPMALGRVSCAHVTSLLTDDDLFLFNQGTHYRLYDKLGAHIVDGGTYFAVWAPNASAGSAIGGWNSWRA